jgi:hypothetical protein
MRDFRPSTLAFDQAPRRGRRSGDRVEPAPHHHPSDEELIRGQDVAVTPEPHLFGV